MLHNVNKTTVDSH